MFEWCANVAPDWPESFPPFVLAQCRCNSILTQIHTHMWYCCAILCPTVPPLCSILDGWLGYFQSEPSDSSRLSITEGTLHTSQHTQGSVLFCVKLTRQRQIVCKSRVEPGSMKTLSVMLSSGHTLPLQFHVHTHKMTSQLIFTIRFYSYY